MLEFLILLPLVMVTILSMTFDVSVDEISNASRGNYFSYDASKDDEHTLQRKVHQFYTRMLEDSKNEIEGSDHTNSNRRKKGQTCDIQAVQSMHRRCLCNKPRKSCVPIEPSGSNVILTMPQCAFVERCQGICPLNRQCRPTAVEAIKIPVIYVNRIMTSLGEEAVMSECTTLVEEKHLKCSCSCAVTKDDCSPNQIFNPSTCRCDCQHPQRADDCKKSGKQWDTASCDCICPSSIPQICSTGAFFHPELCRCIPVGSSHGSKRRRPPV